MDWLGWTQILRCSQDDQVRGKAFTEPVLSHAEGLKQGPPSDVSVRPGGRAAGVRHWEG